MTDYSEPINPSATKRAEPLVLVVPPEALALPKSGADPREIWDTLWRGKWLILLGTLAAAVASVSYALTATEWYRAETLLLPQSAETTQGLSSQFGNLSGLASLAGINFDIAGKSMEPVAVLRSRELLRRFIEEENLLPVLFADQWDSASAKWKEVNEQEQPDVRDGIKLFEERIRTIQEDRKTGMVRLVIEWKHPKLAAVWATKLVERVNAQMRQTALSEAEANSRFLQQQLAVTNVVTLQQPLTRLLEHEMQVLMLARGNREYAFRVIDPATAPKWRSRPKRSQIVALATLGGGMLSVGLVFLLDGLRRRSAGKSDQLSRDS